MARFLSIAAGALSEVEYQLLLSHDPGYLDETIYRDLNNQVNEVKRMLNAFLRTLTANC